MNMEVSVCVYMCVCVCVLRGVKDEGGGNVGGRTGGGLEMWNDVVLFVI